MAFNKKIQPGEHEIEKHGTIDVLKINCKNYPYLPSIEDNAIGMAKVIDKLIEIPSAQKIKLVDRRNYEYNYDQTRMLMEIANLYKYLIKEKKILNLSIDPYNDYFRVNLQALIINTLKADPIGAYVELKRLIRDEKIKIENTEYLDEINTKTNYLELLSKLLRLFENTKLISSAKPYLAGHEFGSRDIYKQIIKPTITPDFMFTRLMAQPPLHSEELDAYSIGRIEVNIFKIPEQIQHLYHVRPPEFKLSEEKYELLDMARNALTEHKPKRDELIDPERMRQTFYNIGRDLIQELSEHKGLQLKYKELNELARILVRYTVGFGLIEILLEDPKIQDITINGPIGESPIFILHQDYHECVTNLYPSREDGESWASKFRILSGRPLDEANPVLDTELVLPKARARVGIMGKPLSPTGLAYAFRRHRDQPWTYPLFIKNRMLSPIAAGLLSFLVDGNRTLLFAGTRSSGKTSILGATLVEIMRRYRIISIEDTEELPVDALRKLNYNIQSMKVRSALTKTSAEMEADEGIRTSLRFGDSALIVGEIRSSIRGNEEVFIIEENQPKRIQIKDIENKNIENIYIPSMDPDLNFRLKKLLGFVKHPKRKKLLKIKTKTGRKVTVTPDHSLFTTKNFKIFPIECKDLILGSKIIIPEKIPCGYNNIKELNLTEYLKEFKLENYENDLKKAIKKVGWKKASEICKTSNDIYQYLRKDTQHTNIPIKHFKNLMFESQLEMNLSSMNIKQGTSKTLPVMLPITKEFCRFIGYYISEGYTCKNSSFITISNSNPQIIEDVINISRNEFKIEPYVRTTFGLGESKQICLKNRVLVELINKLGCGRIAKEKRVPSLIYGLSEEKIVEVLKGLYDGDGSLTVSKSSGNNIKYHTISKKLAEDVLYLLLCIGIVGRLYKGYNKKDNRWKTYNRIYNVEIKQRKYVEIFMEKVGFTKYKKDLIKKTDGHSSLNTVNYDLKELEKNLKLIRKYRHLRKYNSCGKEFLKKIVNDPRTNSSQKIKSFAEGKFFIDEVKSIEEINLDEGEYVYDLAVEPGQNFVGGFGGLLLHNTEATALYEAMRIGALSNVVAGTIHGANPYGVFDRVVNDLKVPRTSFKATDIIIVSNPIRSADGLHRHRRILSITEVRKHWEKDPLRERGFVDLMKYNSKTDSLEPTQDLINGDSEIIKEIAGNVKEWVGNWDAVWENILLRAKIKETLVNYSNKLNLNYILESKFVVESNDMFHRISDSIIEEHGSLDNKKIYYEWHEWLKRTLKKPILE